MAGQGPSIDDILDRAREQMLTDMAQQTVVGLARDLTLKDLNSVLKLIGEHHPVTEYPPEVLTDASRSCWPWRRGR
jgi:hypothetical protein